MATFQIPLTTIAAGHTDLGSAPIPVGSTNASLTIDRTAGTNPLNSTPTADVTFHIDIMIDGVNWQKAWDGRIHGGQTFDRDNNPVTVVNQLVGGCSLAGNPNDPSRQARVSIDSSVLVTVAGSLTL